MLQSNLAKVDHFQPDSVVIGGRTLEFDSILNDAFFTPRKIAELSKRFKHNKPFPHLVFDNLFSPDLLELMLFDFDRLKSNDLLLYNNTNEKKFGTRPFTRLGHASQLYFNTIHSARFVSFLEQITGIEPLIADPGLNNGGLHAIPTGGKFAVHIDFNQHEYTKLDNRLVFITYLNKDWLPSYGGTLELWDIEEEKCEAEVSPIFGRSVLFAHSSKSLHGHPTPVAAPDRRPRRSAAAYFYTHGRSDGENPDFHTTLIFQRRKGSRSDKIAASIKYVTPPVIVDAIQKLKALWKK